MGFTNPSSSSNSKQNIFTLNAEIEFLKKGLEKSKDPALSKVRDIFQKKELETVKTDISEKLSNLKKNAPNIETEEAVRVLQVTWEKVRSHLTDEEEISTLLQSATAELKEQMDRFYAKNFEVEVSVVKEPEWGERVTKAVKAHFETVSDPQIVKEKFPKTTHDLFELALKIFEGKYGERLRNAVVLSRDEFSSYQSILSFLMIDLYRTIPENEFKQKAPELFSRIPDSAEFHELRNIIRSLKSEEIENLLLSPKDTLEPKLLVCKKGLDRLLSSLREKNSDFKALRQIFEEYANKISNPSHLTVKLFLEMGEEDRAIKMAESMDKQPIEQSKSLDALIDKSLSSGKIDQAQKFASKILIQPVKIKADIKIVEKYLHEDREKEAIAYANSLKNPEEFKSLIEDIVMGLAAKGQLKKALTLASSLESDDKSYTLSRLTQLLASKGQFPKAMDLALSIEEPGYRKDAITYVLNPLLSLRKLDDASAFVARIQKPKEQEVAAKIVERKTAAIRGDQKIRNKAQNLLISSFISKKGL